LGAPGRKVYEAVLAIRISNATEDSEDLLPLQLSYSSIFLQKVRNHHCNYPQKN